MKFDPCTCSADRVCIACRELDALFNRAEQEALVELGKAVYAVARNMRERKR
jgi:hypothetical protein